MVEEGETGERAIPIRARRAWVGVILVILVAGITLPFAWGFAWEEVPKALETGRGSALEATGGWGLSWVGTGLALFLLHLAWNAGAYRVGRRGIRLAPQLLWSRVLAWEDLETVEKVKRNPTGNQPSFWVWSLQTGGGDGASIRIDTLPDPARRLLGELFRAWQDGDEETFREELDRAIREHGRPVPGSALHRALFVVCGLLVLVGLAGAAYLYPM